jgi:glutamine amidotransferase
VVAEVTATIRQHGIFNFMLSNGDFLLAHCSTKLHYLVRQAPFAEAHLLDEDMSIDFNQVTTPNDRVAVIATLPLTDNETWTAFAEGELMLFRDGLPTTITVPMPNGRDKIATNS